MSRQPGLVTDDARAALLAVYSILLRAAERAEASEQEEAPAGTGAEIKGARRGTNVDAPSTRS